jgi:cytochrome P450
LAALAVGPTFRFAEAKSMRFSSIPMLSGPRWGSHVEEYKHERLAFLRRAVDECGELARASFLGREVVLASGPEVLHEVLVEKARSFRKSPMVRLVLYPLAGEGLFTSEGALWKRQRRLMAPMFHHEQIATFAESMTDVASRSARAMKDGETISVAQATTQITMSVVGKALFDAETFDEADDLGHALTVALSWSDSLVATWPVALQLGVREWLEGIEREGTGRKKAAAARALEVLEVPLRYRMSRAGGGIREAIETIDARVNRMISDRRALRIERHDLLSQLLRARDDGPDDDRRAMSDRQIRDEAVTLFVAGHETTATSLAWALHELAQAPELYARVQAEGDRFAGRTPRVDELGSLATCSRVFKEALRKYPPVYAFGRQALEDVKIGGYDIPAGTIILVSVYGLHHNRAVYSNPDRFDPERFTADAEAARHRSAWLPFSAGPRVCIGNHFALLEGQLVLAALSHRVAFEAKRGVVVKPAPAATLRPSEGLPMVVRRRAPPFAAQNITPSSA